MSTIVTRAGKGSPLTNTELDSNFTNLNTDKLELSGGTLTGNLSLGDGISANFGASNDLTITHTGSSSILKENGTGTFYIQGTDIVFTNSAGSERYADFTDNGAVRLYHDNSIKLATTSTGISISNDANFPDNGKAIFGADDDFKIYHTATGNHSIIEETGGGNLVVRTNGSQIEFDKGSTEYMARMIPDGAVELYYDSALKLATTSTGIDVTGSVVADGLTVSNGTNTTAIPATSDRVSFTATSSYIQSTGSFYVQPTGDLVLNGTGSEIMRLKSSKVGINNSNPATALDVTGTITADGLTVDGTSLFSKDGGAAQTTAVLIRNTSSSDQTSAMTADLDFSLWDNNTRLSTPHARIGVYGDSTADQNYEAGGQLAFYTNIRSYTSPSLTKRMLIDSFGDISFYDGSGNQGLFWDSSTSRLGLGTTAPNTNVQIYHATDDVSINVNHGTGGSYPKKSGISFGAISTALGGDTTFTGGAGIQVINTAAANAPTEMLFFTTSGGAPTERLKINADGSSVFSGSVTSPQLKTEGTEPTLFFNDTTTGHDDWKMYADWDQFYIQQYVNDTTWTSRLHFAANGNATFSGSVTSTGLTVNATGSAIELSQSATGSATYYTMDNTVETGGKRWRFGYSGGSSDKGSFSFYNQTDNNLALLLASSGATFSGSVTVSKGGSTAAHGDTDLLVRHNSATSTTAQAQILAGNAGYSNLYFSDTDSYNVGGFIYNHASNYLATNVNGSERLRIDSQGRVGISNSSPEQPITVGDTSDSQNYIQIKTSATGAAGLLFSDGASTNPAGYLYDHATNSMQFKVNGSERMRLSGSTLDVGRGTVADATVLIDSGAGGDPTLEFDTGATNRSAIIRFKDQGTTSGFINYHHQYDRMDFGSGSSTGIGMSLTDGGNLLVGKTSSSFTTAGAEVQPSGRIELTRSGELMNLNRLGSDGNLMRFYGSSALVGSIGTYSGDLWIGQGNTGLLFNDGGDVIRSAHASGGNRDGVCDLGASNSRFKDLYLSNNATAQKLTLTKAPVGTYTIEVDGTNTGQPNLIVKQSTTERFRCDNNGKFLVGTTSTTPAFSTGTGIAFVPTGESMMSANSTTALFLNRTTSDGNILDFRKDGSTVGSIGTDTSRFKVKSHSLALYLENESNKQLVWGNVSGVPYFYPQSDNDTNIGYPTQRFKDLYLSGKIYGSTLGIGDAGIQADQYSNAVKPFRPDITSGTSDNYLDLGTSSDRWKDLYLSSGVYLGGTGAANKLDDYESGTWTPSLLIGTSITYTTTPTGNYTKIGNVVHVTAYIDVSNSDTADSSALTIGGFPFSGSSDSMQFTLGRYRNFLAPKDSAVLGASVEGTFCRLFESNNNFILYSEIQSSGILSFSGTYRV